MHASFHLATPAVVHGNWVNVCKKTAFGHSVHVCCPHIDEYAYARLLGFLGKRLEQLPPIVRSDISEMARCLHINLRRCTPRIGVR
jgi:hypothetical protein